MISKNFIELQHTYFVEKYRYYDHRTILFYQDKDFRFYLISYFSFQQAYRNQAGAAAAAAAAAANLQSPQLALLQQQQFLAQQQLAGNRY